MEYQEAITYWIGQLQAGDQTAAQKIWECYFQRLVGLARKKLQDMPRRVADEEDVALSALNSFYRGATEGRFPQLRDREDLWRILVTVTARKAFHFMRDEKRQKRGAGAVLGESALLGPGGSPDEEVGLQQILSREPTPEFAAQVAEECQRRMDSLGDAELQSIALWKMEGDTTEQIARKIGCAPSTVERRLRLIRSIWEKEATL